MPPPCSFHHVSSDQEASPLPVKGCRSAYPSRKRSRCRLKPRAHRTHPTLSSFRRIARIIGPDQGIAASREEEHRNEALGTRQSRGKAEWGRAGKLPVGREGETRQEKRHRGIFDSIAMPPPSETFVTARAPHDDEGRDGGEAVMAATKPEALLDTEATGPRRNQSTRQSGASAWLNGSNA